MDKYRAVLLFLCIIIIALFEGDEKKNCWPFETICGYLSFSKHLHVYADIEGLDFAYKFIGVLISHGDVRACF